LPLPRRRFLQVITLGGALVLAGCETPQPEAPTATPTPTPQAILELASRRLADTPSVHFVLDVQGDTFVDSAHSIRLLAAEGDLVRPDRVHTTFQVEVVGRAVTLQLITIGDKSWTTNILTGAWGDAPLEFAYRPDILFSTQNGIGPMMGRVQGVERLADEKISGRQTYHVRATVDQAIVGPLTYYTLAGEPITVDLWIDQATSDLLRAQLAEPPAPERPHPALWTLDLSHHGEQISIAPPQQS
jgi:LppX_LprAFG lipoprotein